MSTPGDADRYRHRTKDKGTGVITALCGKLWQPTVYGLLARRYPACPTCFDQERPTRTRVVA